MLRGFLRLCHSHCAPHGTSASSSGSGLLSSSQKDHVIVPGVFHIGCAQVPCHRAASLSQPSWCTGHRLVAHRLIGRRTLFWVASLCMLHLARQHILYLSQWQPNRGSYCTGARCDKQFDIYKTAFVTFLYAPKPPDGRLSVPCRWAACAAVAYRDPQWHTKGCRRGQGPRSSLAITPTKTSCAVWVVLDLTWVCFYGSSDRIDRYYDRNTSPHLMTRFDFKVESSAYKWHRSRCFRTHGVARRERHGSGCANHFVEA